MKKAVLYIRAKQGQMGYLERLEQQKSDLLQYCKQNNIEVLKIFSDTSNETSFYRTGFINFLLYTKSNHSDIDLFLFTSWDRFSRMGIESYKMVQNLKKLSIEVQAILNPINWEAPEGELYLSIYLTTPVDQLNKRSERIKKGIEYKRNQTNK